MPSANIQVEHVYTEICKKKGVGEGKGGRLGSIGPCVVIHIVSTVKPILVQRFGSMLLRIGLGDHG